jgi:hypothetical protein
MLEGQVAALSSGLLSSAEALQVLRALRQSALYRSDAKSYLLYPNRELALFLDKNVISEKELVRSPLLERMLAEGDERLVCRDAAGQTRFVSHLVNAPALRAELDRLGVIEERDAILAIYESVFHHHAFTGRSGTMFAFEGLGSIYWHMVAKLLLATQECFFAAIDRAEPAKTISGLAAKYYEIRSGLGFNRTPAEYGAFPTDPYSHSPAQAGAQQPGMTGQVKEELITRLGELGVRFINGTVHFQPALLREMEFLKEPSEFTFSSTTGEVRTIPLAAHSLAFTVCQTPIIYNLADSHSIEVCCADHSARPHAGNSLSPEASRSLLRRDGEIESVTVGIPAATLLHL